MYIYIHCIHIHPTHRHDYANINETSFKYNMILAPCQMRYMQSAYLYNLYQRFKYHHAYYVFILRACVDLHVLVMSTGFHAELHRRRCGVVVRSRCQDMEARAAGGPCWLGKQIQPRGENQFSPSENPHLTMDSVIPQHHWHLSCWGLASLGHGHFVPCLTGDRCCIVGSSYVGVHGILVDEVAAKLLSWHYW